MARGRKRNENKVVRRTLMLPDPVYVAISKLAEELGTTMTIVTETLVEKFGGSPDLRAAVAETVKKRELEKPGSLLSQLKAMSEPERAALLAMLPE